MKAYYLEDKIKETNDPLKVKVLKLVYANAAHNVNSYVNDTSWNSMMHNNVIDDMIFDIYDIPTLSIFPKIQFASIYATEILIRELMDTYRPYKENGLNLDADGHIEHRFKSGFNTKDSDKTLCIKFNKQIDDICNLIKESKKEVD